MAKWGGSAGRTRLPRATPAKQPATGDVLFRGESPLWKVVCQRVRWARCSVDPWWLALLDRAGLVGRRGLRSFDIRRQDGTTARLLVRLGGADQRTINEVWLGRAYDQRIDAWGSGKLDVVFDLGANAGYFSVLAGRLAPGALVVSVEPDPENQKLLAANLGINEIPPTIVRAAVAAAVPEQPTRLHRSSDPRLHTTKPRPVSQSLTGEVLDVEVVTLAQLCRQHAPPPARIGLKIDIEGDEWSVLRSLPDEVWDRVLVVAVESDDPMPRSLQEHIERLGFSVAVDGGALYSICRSVR